MAISKNLFKEHLKNHLEYHSGEMSQTVFHNKMKKSLENLESQERT